jgi:hypothetical protein
MNWLKDRLRERTTLDGVALIIICGSVIVLGGIVTTVAWAGLAYGLFTTIKGESGNVARRRRNSIWE